MNPDLSGGLDPDPAGIQGFLKDPRELIPIVRAPVFLKQGEPAFTELRLEARDHLIEGVVGESGEQVFLRFQKARPGV